MLELKQTFGLKYFCHSAYISYNEFHRLLFIMLAVCVAEKNRKQKNAKILWERFQKSNIKIRSKVLEISLNMCEFVIYEISGSILRNFDYLIFLRCSYSCYAIL